MESYEGAMAVVTGGGTGMGRELVLQLAAAGAHVAMCDVNEDNMGETARRVAATGSTVRVSSHVCDVSDESQVLAFRDGVVEAHQTDHITVLFNNAGIGGSGSFVAGDREAWERTWGVCWNGVYFCLRAFMPLLMAAETGAVVNTSSVNGFWASIGGDRPHTSYSAAKFAVKGLTEALITDFRLTAPHLSAHVVMPGHIGTAISKNSAAAHGVDVTSIRKQMARAGHDVDQLDDADIEALMERRAQAFEDDAPTSSAQAAKIILDAVLAGEWRILVGADAHALDEMVRADPEGAYEPEFLDRLHAAGHMRALIPASSE